MPRALGPLNLLPVLVAIVLGACATTEELNTPPQRDAGSDTSSADAGDDGSGGDDTAGDAADADTDASDVGSADAPDDAFEPDADVSSDPCNGVDCSALEDACNTATCDPTTGACVARPVDDGTECDVGGCLTGGTCASGVCEGVPVDDGTTCDDGDDCTLDDTCTSGTCAGVERDCTAFDGPCAVGACDPTSGACEAVAVADDTACDTDRCVADQRCVEGVCGGGTPADCSASDTACGTGVCNRETGACETLDLEDGTPCDDGGACTTGDVCAGGVCAGDATDCSEGDGVCRIGFCRADDGACDVRDADDGAPCDDGDPCTVDTTCADGTCVGVPRDCSALDDGCNVGVCNAESGACEAIPLDDGIACDDASACTTEDVCSAGVCAGTPLDCSGLSDGCNVGVCDVVDGVCVAAPVDDGTACSDDDACTVGDACRAGACAGTALDCSGDDGACTTGTCNPDTGACEAVPFDDGTPCDDLDGCTTADVCTAGACAGTDLDCAEGLTPCQTSTCDAEAGACGPVIDAAPCTVCPDGVCGAGGTCVGSLTEVAWGFEDGAVPVSWTATGDAPWRATDATAAGGSWSLASGDIGSNDTSGLVATVAFPVDVRLTFALRVSSEASYDFLRLFVDGAEVEAWSGTVTWTTYELDLPAGPHTIEWRYTKDASLSSGSDTAWIDDVRFVPPPGPASTFAAWDFEAPGLPAGFSTSGDASWFVSTASASSGAQSAESGDIGDSDVTRLTTTAEWPGAGTVSFALRVSSESSYDYLEFYIDGERVERWSGTVDWRTVTYPVSAGSHTLEWVYDKDSSVSLGADTAWIDDVVLTAETSAGGDLCSPAE